jgi:hypothetical protein
MLGQVMFSKTTTLLTAITNRLAVNAELPESTTHTYILIFDSVRAGRLKPLHQILMIK